MSVKFNQVIWIVLDGVGAGALPDANTYGDEGANTLGNLNPLFLPHLEKMGLGNITPMRGVKPLEKDQGHGFFGRCTEKSQGKDTTSGHWEMAGLIVEKAFQTFPHGFPKDIVEKWVKENNLRGILGNKAASGTEIIEELGLEHVKTGKPILYTSADSVWQVAAHETHFGLEKLYSICKSARKICNSLEISRVIARPFIGKGEKGDPFKRTYHRKDYSLKPFGPTYLDELSHLKIPTYGIGKISSIFAGHGILENKDTQGNTDGLKVLLDHLKSNPTGLLFCNLIDFDMLFGHRRDVIGFGKALEEFDQALPQIRSLMGPESLLLITADHGNDPTFRGTDHTREYIPILGCTSQQKKTGALNLGIRETFADIGATVFDALSGHTLPPLAGRSFLKEIL